jgi:hypothetical protein
LADQGVRAGTGHAHGFLTIRRVCATTAFYFCKAGQFLRKGHTMNDKNVGAVHWSFWAIGALALIWNVMGVINFLVQMNPDMLAAYRESERAIIAGRPAWATGGFAVAVFGGALGGLLLLLRKTAAYYFFIASLLGVVVTMAHALGAGIHFGPGEIVGIILMPLAVAAFLIWYSKRSGNKGWIG